MPSRLEDRGADALCELLRARGLRRASLVRDHESGALLPSIPELAPLAHRLESECDAYADHEAIFLEVGENTGALLSAFIHRCERGQAQGGLRHWPYATLLDLLRDGLRLSQGMGRKSALAGLWWGGGKGIIARPNADDARLDPEQRRALYADYGRFVTSLRGCYVTAEDAGTTPDDMATLHAHTRFATCLPPEVGGSGNPSPMTADGVVCAMQSALDFMGAGAIEGKRIAMQGGGQVGSCMIERLLERGAREIVVAELDRGQRDALSDRFAGRPVEVRAAAPGDASILAGECDVLVPNALGGVLDAKTIPAIRARLVCGAANNPLADPASDGRRLAQRGIVHVPDYVANRMGIVACSNEHAGQLPQDPAILRHLDPAWPDSIPAVTWRVLERAAREDIPPVEAADRLADERTLEPHPIWGDRTRRIIASLADGDWAAS